MKDVRVLHIGLSSNIGGIETVVYSWLNNKPDWLHFDFIQIGDNPIAFKKEFLNAGSDIFQITPRKECLYKSNYELKNLVMERGYDYVHHHIMSYSWPEPAIIVNDNCNSKMILHAHTVLNNQCATKYKILHRLGKMRLSGKKLLELACSMEAGLSMFNNNQYTVIRNGINFDECSFNKHERCIIRSQYGYSDDEFIVGHVGRSSYEKNYPFLLQSFKALHDSIPETRLFLVGDITGDKVVQSLIDALGLRESTVCTGKVGNVKSYYSAMDVFFLPSITEGVSLSLLEAQASGLPCVISANISKESVISNKCDITSIDDASETARLLRKALSRRLENRNNVLLDKQYDLKRTSAELYCYYYNHLE